MKQTKNEAKELILSLLREGKYTSNEIADFVGVTKQVVWGIKSQYSLGKYGDAPKPKIEARTGKSWAYLILSERGEVYLGASGNLKGRIKSHNSISNTGYTKGRKWHLLAAKKFHTPRGGFEFETELKKSQRKKRQWKIESISRAIKIVSRYGYAFDPNSWLPESTSENSF